MARLLYAESFLESAADLHSPRVISKLEDTLRAIEAFPRIGSRSLPASIRESFGDGVYKMVVCQFDLIYSYDEKTGVVAIYDLVPCRMAR